MHIILQSTAATIIVTILLMAALVLLGIALRLYYDLRTARQVLSEVILEMAGVDTAALGALVDTKVDEYDDQLDRLTVLAINDARRKMSQPSTFDLDVDRALRIIDE